MMAVFLKSFGNVLLIDVVAHTNIFGKRIIGPPKNIQSVTHWRKIKLRMVAHHKVFVPAIVTYHLQPWSIRFQCEYQLCCTDQIPQEAIIEGKCETMCELHDCMSFVRIQI